MGRVRSRRRIAARTQASCTRCLLLRPMPMTTPRGDLVGQVLPQIQRRRPCSALSGPNIGRQNRPLEQVDRSRDGSGTRTRISKASRHRRGEPTRPSSHATSLDLGSADRVRRVRSPSAERLRTSGGGVASRLVLHFRVQLCAHQDDDNPDPGHETDDRPERAVSFVIAAEIGDVPREQNRCSQQNNRGSYTAAAQPAPPRLLAAGPASVKDLER